MARAMVLGNGNTLACLDNFGQLRDLYYPYAGQENHIGSNQLHKIGVFVDGSISWLDDSSWQTSIYYEDNSMVSKLFAENQGKKIRLESNDIVYNEKNIFLRKFTLTNLDSKEREVKIFFDQQFKIGDTNHADTAYFSSTLQSIIHYKGRRVFLVGGSCNNKPFSDYAIGFFGMLGKEGTWKDAEDGVLSKNTIEHGNVDSVISWNKSLKSNESMVVYYWIIAGETYKEVYSLLEYINQKSGEHILESTRDFWKAWANQVEVSFHDFSQKVVSLFYSSLFVMRAHSDNRGGILASSDSGNVQYGGDTYVYIWPRDATFTALSFDMAGFFDVSKRFYKFIMSVITEDGYVLHKYQPDKSLGSSWHPWVRDGKRQLAIQEDETAILLVGLWEHYIRAKDLEFIESNYNTFIKSAADFLIRFKDFNTGLPLSSYDLWEEKYGVSSYTTSVVYGGLMAAYNFARVLGKEEDAAKFYNEAEIFKRSILNNLWSNEIRSFIKLNQDGNSLRKDNVVDVSNFYGVFKFSVLGVEDERLLHTFNLVKESLYVGEPTRGFSRYFGDNYCRRDALKPANPWFISALWIAQFIISKASSLQDLDEAKDIIENVAKFSYFHMLSEQIDSVDGSILSATPLVWSHSEFVRTILEYDNKFKTLSS